MSNTIGVDIGGTKIAAAVVSDEGTVVARLRRETPSTSEAAIRRAIAEVVRTLKNSHECAAVGISAAGFVDRRRRKVVFAPNLAWRDEPLADHLEADTGLPTLLENDANAAAWGEFRYGAAQDAEDTVMVTIGTGIGGGIVVDGQLLRGGYGMAAEIGHMRVVRGGLLCGCGNRGCWEQYGSGTALTRLGRELVAGGGAQATRLAELADSSPENVRGQMITLAAQEGDPACVELLRAFGEGFGEALASITAVLDPELIVIGGGAAAAGDLLLAPMRQAFADHLIGSGYRPLAPITVATLGNDAGMIGAADLARVLV
ncbi:MAG: ROK family glucokinase [Actinomycetales bacterium]